MPNNTLRQARAAKKDEFYTQYEDIQAEVNAYIDYNPDVFRGKTILLPCDDPEWSNFTRFFAENFETFGLKKLISTSFAIESKNSKWYEPTLFEVEAPQFDKDKTRTHGKIFILDHDTNANGRIDVDDLQWKYLEGDGDFRSNEVRALRDEADIIVTNPPFSLFREFVAWIMEANKQFLILGNINNICYKEIFPLIMSNKMWPGKRLNQRVHGDNMTFMVPNDYPMTGTELYIENGKKYISVAGTGWFTNLEHGRRHQKLKLMTWDENVKYSKHKEIKGIGYQKYINYNALEVPFSDAIPSDYDELMGVPVTFISKYCPEQFEIIGISLTLATTKPANLPKAQQGGPAFYLGKEGNYQRLYPRIVIRKKH